MREIYREGQPAPAAVGGTFSGVLAWWTPHLAEDGTMTFWSDVAGGSAIGGLFRSSPSGVIDPLLLVGDAVTTPGGGSFISFFQHFGGNRHGDIALYALIERASESRWAVFALESDVQREILSQGDPIPGEIPARIFRSPAGIGEPGLNRDGSAAFAADLTDESYSIDDYAILVDDGNGIGVLVRAGDPVPGAPGHTFTEFGVVRLIDDGTIAFDADTTGGAGVFMATKPAPVNGISPIGLVLLAMSLVFATVLYRYRRYA